MTSFLPALEDTLVDLLQYGDTGALRVSLDEQRWTFFVQGGVLVGVTREPAPADPTTDATEHATRMLAEAMQAKGALWDFNEGASPDDFGLYDVRRALADAMGRARDASELIRALQEVLDGWPELNVDADTLSGDPEIQTWLQSLDGLAPGSARLTEAPAQPGPALGALWVAWKLGDLDLHIGSIDDEEPSDIIDIKGEDPIVDDPHERAEVKAIDDSSHDFEHEGEDADDDTAQTLHSSPSTAADRRRLLVEMAGRNRSVREDPFVSGVAKARADEVEDALPLLEQAWEEDPDRPGLEEWLGYTRFAACRDSDPDKARQGMTMLRDAMYRTTPSGETPILPWILMARAQLQRGDLVQARSQLNAVLEREPDGAEAMFLDTELRQAEAEAEALKDTEEGVSVSRIARVTGGFVLLTAIVLGLQVHDSTTDIRTDYADLVASVVQLRELNRVARGWVGVTAPGWIQPARHDQVVELCDEVAITVQMKHDETLLLLDHGGVPLTECGERVALPAPPPEPAQRRGPDADPQPDQQDSAAGHDTGAQGEPALGSDQEPDAAAPIDDGQ